MPPVKTRKKLIEVALPLEAINTAAAREKSIRHGHPSTLHLWWARRPLAAARAVIFSQMVDDPGACPEEFPTEADQEQERQRLFRLIEALVQWENTTNETVLNQARAEIRRSWRRTCADNAGHPQAAELFNPEQLPGFHDPFAGGGALPLEAQRLGLETYASDLNPVAVTINKAMIEIPPKFAGQPPVNPESRKTQDLNRWQGAKGLAEDVRYYGKWMRDEAEKRIGHLYPKVEITAEMAAERPDLQPYVGQKLTVIAWLWARTVKSPNPAFSHVDVPLASTWEVSKKVGKEAWIEISCDRERQSYSFKVKTSGDKHLSPTVNRRGTTCIMSGDPISLAYIREQGRAGRMGRKLMAIIVEGNRGRIYLSPSDDLLPPEPTTETFWYPDLDINYHPRDIKTQTYGLMKYGDLFTPRQLVALTTFSDLVGEAMIAQVYKDALAAGMASNDQGLDAGSTGAKAYAEAVGMYLVFAIDKLTDRGSTICSWDSSRDSLRNTFGRQAIPMTWDFAEANFLSASSGSIENACDQVYRFLRESITSGSIGCATQLDAQSQNISQDKVISTDPPYYDNIGYADLSDFFYVWLRRSLKPIFPSLYATLAVPKAEELVATPYRHGSQEAAEAFFLKGMTRAIHNLAEQAHPGFPVTIYYAFKQAETRTDQGTSSTGWETFLEAVLKAGFGIDGTWPMRTELGNRMISSGTNALASSIVLVCRRRPKDAATISRAEFRRTLRQELPAALVELEKSNIAPVDLAQSAIGPGMAIFSRYSAVLNPDDSPMTVREALYLINEVLAEFLNEQEGELDPDSRFAVTWYETYGYDEAPYGSAETLATARNLSVAGVAEAGILKAIAGKVRLLRREELPPDWDPSQDKRVTTWEATQYLIRALETGGEPEAAALLAQLQQLPGNVAAGARALAYRLYTQGDRTGKAEEARAYNGLVVAWPELERQAQAVAPPLPPSQMSML
jgi:putative DNA methylase